MMSIRGYPSRREALKLLSAPASALLVGSAAARSPERAITLSPGPFTNSRESLTSYQIPEWFADAKFGYGRTGDRSQPWAMATGMREECTSRDLNSINII